MSNSQVTLEDVVAQGPGNLVSDMDGEKVMMSIGSGKYYNLGQVGGRIWELMVSEIPVSGLVSSLMDEYEIEQQQCEAHVLSFLQHLNKEGLIQIKDRVK